MRVFVTGGSGFVGCHVISELVTAGHEVVALVRSRDRLERALHPLGCAPVQAVLGDLSSVDVLRREMKSADAVVHAAGVYTFDARRAREMYETNVDGTRRVLTLAAEARCDPIVHVSSVTALWPLPKKPPAPAEPKVGTARGLYTGTKRAAEAIARQLQAEGAPIVCTHPGNVFGPHDPGPGEMRYLLRGFLGNRYPFLLFGAGMSVADVRWLAKAHAALLVPGQGPRLAPMGGRYLTWNEIFSVLRAITGRWLPQYIPSPRFLTVALGWLSDRLRCRFGLELPFAADQNSAVYLAGWTDDSLVESLVGPHPDVERTLRDSVSWLAEKGHLPARWAGKVNLGPRTSPVRA